MPTDPASPSPVAAAVVVYAARVLLVRRRVPEGPLCWQFPAGKVTPGEVAGQAAARECGEETGLTVEPIRLLGSRIHPDTGRRMSYVACSVVAGVARVASPGEVAEVAWVNREEIPEYVPQGLFGPVQEYLDGALVEG